VFTLAEAAKESTVKVNSLDHVNIRTRDVAASAQFYVQVLGLTARSGPAPFPPEQVQWLCDVAGRAILHLFRYDCAPGPTGPIHHVALSCSGKARAIDRLKACGADFRVREVPAASLTQIFLTDLNGILFELNFAEVG
jgi:catechol 2,3-dioxygenase-like lactoylglutathione lyase family enzyme